jgi:hypothetical protein
MARQDRSTLDFAAGAGESMMVFLMLVLSVEQDSLTRRKALRHQIKCGRFKERFSERGFDRATSPA